MRQEFAIYCMPMLTEQSAIIACNEYKGFYSSLEIGRKISDYLVGCSRTAIYPFSDGGGDVASCLDFYIAGLTSFTCSSIDCFGIHRDLVVHQTMDDGREDLYVQASDLLGFKILQPGQIYDTLSLSSYGLGVLIKKLIEERRPRPRSITVFLGGGIVTDAGLGLLSGLGAGVQLKGELRSDKGLNFWDLSRVERLDFEPIFELTATTALNAVVDVETPLVGAGGAIRCFGPQKGIVSTAALSEAERVFFAWGDMLQRSSKGRCDPSQPLTGGMGGIAAVFSCLNSKMALGAEYFYALSQFEEKLKGSSILITGEGKIDSTSFFGKTPVFLARKAKSLGIPVYGVFAKKDDSVDSAMHELFDHVYLIGGKSNSGLGELISI